MSSILYREGKGTVEHGIVCESTICEPGEVEGLLAAGWSANPPGYVPPEPVAAELDLDPVEGIDELKSDLDSQIDSLKEQNRILTDLDEASKTEIQRLNSEVERLTGELAFAAEAEEALKAEITSLNDKLNAIPVEDEEHPANDDESGLNPVRQAAKDAGIEGWDTKRIATLERMLEA